MLTLTTYKGLWHILSHLIGNRAEAYEQLQNTVKPNFRKVSLVSHIWDELGKREPKGMKNSLRDCDSNLDVIEIWPRMETSGKPLIWARF